MSKKRVAAFTIDRTLLDVVRQCSVVSKVPQSWLVERALEQFLLKFDWEHSIIKIGQENTTAQAA